jgi:predicted  nucleic acid-binding Zn-ribbon protein
MEDNRGAELTRILEGYQKSTNNRMDRLEKDLENRTDRLEKEDTSLQTAIKETTEKFEKALKTTNDAVAGLKEKATGAVAVLALIGMLSPFLPKMIASILPTSPYHVSPSTYPKP